MPSDGQTDDAYCRSVSYTDMRLAQVERELTASDNEVVYHAVRFLNTQSQPVDVLFDSTVFILTFLCDVLVVRSLLFSVLLSLD